jgi:hypothetical protein
MGLRRRLAAVFDVLADEGQTSHVVVRSWIVNILKVGGGPRVFGEQQQYLDHYARGLSRSDLESRWTAATTRLLLADRTRHLGRSQVDLLIGERY